MKKYWLSGFLVLLFCALSLTCVVLACDLKETKETLIRYKNN